MSDQVKRKTYDNEFKEKSVRLVFEEKRKAAEVKRNLGIGRSTADHWVREMIEDPER